MPMDMPSYASSALRFGSVHGHELMHNPRLPSGSAGRVPRKILRRNASIVEIFTDPSSGRVSCILCLSDRWDGCEWAAHNRGGAWTCRISTIFIILPRTRRGSRTSCQENEHTRCKRPPRPHSSLLFYACLEASHSVFLQWATGAFQSSSLGVSIPIPVDSGQSTPARSRSTC